VSSISLQVEQALKAEERKVAMSVIMKGGMAALGPKNQRALVMGIADVAGVDKSAISITGITAISTNGDNTGDGGSSSNGRFGFGPRNIGGSTSTTGEARAVKVDLDLVGSATGE
jgi:hypothetical protein